MDDNPYRAPESEVGQDRGNRVLAVRLPFRLLAFLLGIPLLWNVFDAGYDLVVNRNPYALLILIPFVPITWGVFWLSLTGGPVASADNS